MSFEIIFDSVKEFTDLMATLNNFFDEVQLHIDETGISTRAMDASRVTLVNMKLPDTLFSKYNVSGEVSIALNLEQFLKALKLGRAKDSLLFRYNNDGRLTVGFIGDEKTYIRLPLLEDTNLPETDIPELEWKGKTIILAGAFKRALNAAAFASDAIRITVAPDNVRFRAEGETTSAETILTLEDPSLQDVEAPEGPVEGYYGIPFLQDVVKKLGEQDAVIIRVGPDMPILMKHYFRDEGEVKFLIAPRVEE